jgi:HPt (histidine-containing phosphotransfer) domain-containing protein
MSIDNRYVPLTEELAVLSSLALLADVDFFPALDRMSGKFSLYARILEGFTLDLIERRTNFFTPQNEVDLGLLRLDVHSIKGGASMVGLRSLPIQAGIAEMQLLDWSAQLHEPPTLSMIAEIINPVLKDMDAAIASLPTLHRRMLSMVGKT